MARRRLLELLGHGLRLEEEEQVVAPPRLAVRAAHVEAAEGVAADHGARALAVQVEVADVEALAREGELVTVARPDRARQPVVGRVGGGNRVLERLRARDREDRTEDLLAREARVGLDAV